jgi:hypothetical protein
MDWREVGVRQSFHREPGSVPAFLECVQGIGLPLGAGPSIIIPEPCLKGGQRGNRIPEVGIEHDDTPTGLEQLAKSRRTVPQVETPHPAIAENDVKGRPLHREGRCGQMAIDQPITIDGRIGQPLGAQGLGAVLQ